jgi:serine/threonine protein kinase
MSHFFSEKKADQSVHGRRQQLQTVQERDTMQTTSLSPGTLLRQRYYILEKLGEGGFGAVYKARDENKSGLLVAIKQIHMSRSLSVQDKIEITDSYNREVTLLSALRHNNLPRIYDHFTDPEHWYLVMQYLEGSTLEQVRHTMSQGRLPVREVLTIGIKLCSVLDYLHRQKPPIVFRDVKPDNILLTPGGDPYLIDFGIARRYRTEQARDTGALGSPGYAAPEQYGRARTTPQTDIYGLAATLQTLLTGKDPVELKASGEPADAFIPQGLHALLKWMMEPDPDLRPESMRSVRWHLLEMESDIQKVYYWDKLNAVTSAPVQQIGQPQPSAGLAAQQNPPLRGLQPALLTRKALPMTTWPDSTMPLPPHPLDALPGPAGYHPVLNRSFDFWDIFRLMYKIAWWGIWLFFTLLIVWAIISGQLYPYTGGPGTIIITFILCFILNVILSFALSLILTPCMYLVRGLVCLWYLCLNVRRRHQQRRKQAVQRPRTPLQR